MAVCQRPVYGEWGKLEVPRLLICLNVGEQARSLQILLSGETSDLRFILQVDFYIGVESVLTSGREYSSLLSFLLTNA